MNLFSIELWIVALAITIGILAGCAMFARWCAFSPAVPQFKIEKLQVGMTADEVTAVLGPPRASKATPDGVRQWIYGAPMKRHVLIIEFGRHDKVETFAHGVPDHRRSGTTLDKV